MFGEWQIVPSNLLKVARSADDIAVDLAALIHDGNGALVASMGSIDQPTCLAILSKIEAVLKEEDDRFLQDLGLRNAPSLQAMPLNDFADSQHFETENDKRLWGYRSNSASTSRLIDEGTSFTNQTELTSATSFQSSQMQLAMVYGLPLSL